jgi:hypothetical protein
MNRAILALALIPALAPAQIAKFRVRETAGLRRFSYPVRTTIPPNAASLQLLENSKVIPAQFTPVDGAIEIDFNVSLGPWETREYRVEPGPHTMTKGITISEDGGAFTVHSSNLAFEIPGNMLGLLRGVKLGDVPYLRSGSQGLVLNYKDDAEFRAGGIGHWGAATKATILKRGPLVCAVRFESTEGLRSDRSVKSVVDLTFPRSKSWMEAQWKVEDPERWVSGLMADLNLLVEGAPIMVDFGANDTIYDALRAGGTFALFAGPPQGREPQWSVRLNNEPYASGAKPAEGWAHVMDKQRATAIAVAGFGEETRDRIEVSADGHLLIRRDFAGGSERTLHFWLHFVTNPVQLGAATSPQAMQNPLRIERE